MAVQGGITLPVGLDLKNVDNDVKKLANRFKETTQQIAIQSQKVDELKAKLAGLQSGSITATSAEVKKMQTEFDKTTSSIEKTKAEISSLYQQLDALQANAFVAPDTGEVVLTGKEQAQFDSINAKLDQLEPKLEVNKQKAAELGESLREATGAATQSEINKTSQELQKAETKLEGLKIKAEETGDKIKTNMQSTAPIVGNVATVFDKMGAKLMGMAKRVFVFALMTKALRAMRSTIGSVLMQDEAFRQSLYQLQAALWTAFAPIAAYVIPTIKTLIGWVTNVIVAIGKLIAALTGKSYTAMTKQGQSLYNNSKAYEKNAKSAAKATKATSKQTKEIKKQLAAFDELNILQEDKAEADSGGGGGAGGGAGGGLSNAFGEAAISAGELEQKFQAIAVIVGLIGAGLLAWKITEFVTTLTAGGEAAEILRTKLSGIAGVLMIITGAILTVKGYSDAWVNGITWGNLLTTLSGIALVIGGIALAVSPVAAGFAAIGAGIALFVLGIKDIIANGPNLQNILTIIIGLVVVFVATLAVANLPIAIIVTALTALTGAFIYLWKTNEGFQEFWVNLWETIKRAVSYAWENVLKPTFNAIGNLIKIIWKDIIEPFINDCKTWVLGLWNDSIKPFWENHLKPALEAIGKKLVELWEKTIKPFWENHLKPALEAIEKKLSELWEKTIEPIVKSICKDIQDLWDTYLKPFINWIDDTFVELFRDAFTSLSDIIDTFFDDLSDIVDDIKDVISGIVDFINDIFSGDWKAAWDDIVALFKSSFSLIEDTAKLVINGVIGIINGMINAVETGVNALIKVLNKLKFDVPDWVPGIGGERFGFNFSSVKLGRIPKLADGAVIPPNKKFMAILGDQKSGTNVEAPLATIEQAVENVIERMNISNGANQTFILELDGREVGRTFGNVIQQENNRVGNNFVKTKLVFG